MSVHLNTEAYEKPADPAGERSSIAFVQLEKHNERLKDALVRCVTRAFNQPASENFIVNGVLSILVFETRQAKLNANIVPRLLSWSATWLRPRIFRVRHRKRDRGWFKGLIRRHVCFCSSLRRHAEPA